MTDFQAAIAEVLAGHGIIDRKSRYSGAIFCTCGFHTEYTGRVYDQYRAHQAAMLAPIILDAQAEALREAADALGKQKNGTDGFFAWWLTQRAAQMRAES